MLTSRFEIDVTPGGIPPVVNASQYDAGSRTIEFTLVSGTGDFVPPSGVKAEVRGTKPDGNGFSYEARILGRVVTVVITEQMTAAAGKVRCELALYTGTPATNETPASDDYMQLCTANFILMVERAALDKDTVSSESEVRQLVNIIDRSNEIITTRDGCRWVDSNIKSVLSNITYTGNLLLQKEFIEDPVTKKRRKNKGQLPQYFVENTHEPIIDMETFQYVQDEMARRRELGALANKSLNITCFTGKIKCGFCGKSFMHNTRKNRAKFTTTYTDEDGMYTTWVCGSRKQKQKGDPCVAKEIPDKILKACCAEVLGLAEFDDEVFAERIERIDVPDGGILVFHFYDGTEVTKEWESTAKKDCWTDEHKDRQREWVRNYMAKGEGRFSPFTTRIKCGCCGGSCRRQVQGSSDGKIAYWRCSGSGATNCGIKGIREPDLMEIAAGLMCLPEFDGDVFRDQVDHITMVKSGLLEFTFTDGHTEEAEYSTKRKGKPWTEEQRAKFKESIKGSYTPERRKAMSEHMKQVRRERYWNSKGKSKQSQQP